MILRRRSGRAGASRLTFAALLLALSAACVPDASAPDDAELVPIDAQSVQDQDDMTWADYRPIPGIDWADPSLEPERGFRIALVAVDFPDQPFVMTLPKGSDPFGNPQLDPVPRGDVPRFYRDFFFTPTDVNRGHTINGYWMEQSRGRFGVTEMDHFGPYRMPEPLWAYGLNEFGQEESTPDGSVAESRMEPDVDSLWAAEHGDLRDDYDAVLRIYAGYDETTVWQEFGEMKFTTRDDIPPAWGNPDPERPRWVPTRYVEWTSWLAGAQQWGSASMRQGESSGTITHELGHFAFRLPDLNNNPYVEPYRRVAAGPWDMMDRGSFNGPGGPHMRWVVPPTQGAAMPAGLMLHNRMVSDFVTEDDVLELSREGLAASGVVVAKVTARAVEPRPGAFAGITVRLDGEGGDRTPPGDPATDPLSQGTTPYDFYSLEVVQRIGYDSFTPDDGVLIAKNRDELRGRNGGPNGFNSYIWVIDAKPQDIQEVDFVRPNGDEVMRTIADYRQLNDALFHAGLRSGTEFEWRDPDNRLHFHIIDLERDAEGIRTYTVAVRSLDGSGPHRRGVAVEPGESAGAEVAGSEAAGSDAGGVAGGGSAGGTDSGRPIEIAQRPVEIAERITPVTFTLTNTGEAETVEAGAHPDDIDGFVTSDVYRLTATVEGEGWTVELLNELVAVGAGEAVAVPVYVSPPGPAGSAEPAEPAESAESAGRAGSATPAADAATVRLRARSVSDATVEAEATVDVSSGGL